MKTAPKLILLFFVAALLSGTIPVLADAQQQGQFIAPKLVVNSSFLNVRTGPGVQFSVLITVVGGTELPVLGRAPDGIWFQVSTVVGVGWVNVEFTIPRGSFDNVPVVTLEDVLATGSSTATTIGIVNGQGGGAVVSSTTPSVGGMIRIPLENGRVATAARGERFRAVINVEAVNLRSQPFDGAPALTTLFRDDTYDYSIMGSSRDKAGFDWVAIDVPDVGVGWVEGPKLFIRLSRMSGQVVTITRSALSMTDSPNGSGLNLPVLSEGQEGFLIDISRDGKFVRIELGDGTKGWVPFDSVVTRTGTPTDSVDPTLLQSPLDPGQGGGGAPQPATFGLDTPHLVINTGFLNVRSGPGAQYSILATLPGGTKLPVIGIASDGVWFLVQGSFGQGWVNGEFAVFRGSIKAVPIIRGNVGILAMPVAIVSDSVSLYAAPGTNFGLIGTLTGPAEVDIVARTADNMWLQVNTTVGFSWVLASQVSIRGDLSLAPIVR